MQRNQKPEEISYMLTATNLALSEDYRDELDRLKANASSRSQYQRRGAMQATLHFLLVAGCIFGPITLVAAFFGEAVSLWTEPPLLPVAVLALFAFAVWQGWREGGDFHDLQQGVIEDANKVNASTTARRLSLVLDAESFAIDHEHGRIFMTSNGEGGTSFFDVTTIADDPREAMTKGEKLPSHWQWLDIPGTGFLRDVESSGEVQPLRLYSMDTLDQIDALSRLLDAEDGLDQLNSLPIDPATLEVQIRAALG
jgi:hypothetical protein